MRITYVKKSRIDQGSCSKCRDPLPKGSAYRWIKFRFGGKRKRCMKATCAFRPSDMTTSDKRADFYLAQEDVQDALEVARLADLEDGTVLSEELSGLADVISESADMVQQVAEGFQESADNLEEYFSGSSQIDEINEKEYAAEEFSGELHERASEVRQFAEDLSDEDFEWTVEEVDSLLSEVESTVEGGELP